MLHESELGNDQIQLFFSLGGYEYRLCSTLKEYFDKGDYFCAF